MDSLNSGSVSSKVVHSSSSFLLRRCCALLRFLISSLSKVFVSFHRRLLMCTRVFFTNKGVDIETVAGAGVGEGWLSGGGVVVDKSIVREDNEVDVDSFLNNLLL